MSTSKHIDVKEISANQIAADKLLASEIVSHTIIVDKLNVLHKQYVNTILFIFGILIVLGGVTTVVILRTPKIASISVISTDVNQIKTAVDKTLVAVNALSVVVSKQQDVITHSPIGKPLQMSDMKNVSSSFGPRINSKGDTTYHKAIDIRARKGSPLYAMASGTVLESQYNGGWGNTILVICGNNGFSYRVAHLDSLCVKKGESVLQGQQIGTVGNTGVSTGDHVDIRIMYTANGRVQNINPSMFL